MATKRRYLSLGLCLVFIMPIIIYFMHVILALRTLLVVVVARLAG